MREEVADRGGDFLTMCSFTPSMLYFGWAEMGTIWEDCACRGGCFYL